MSVRTLIIAAVVAASAAYDGAGAAVRNQDRHDVSNRTERMNRDYTLHKKFYPADRSRNQDGRKTEPPMRQPNDNGGLENGRQLLHPSVFEKSNPLTDA
jgi:hypothetical protein